MMKIELDMYQTLALAVVVLTLGKFLRSRISALERFCIPAPVIGGVLFAVFTCVCYVTGIAEFEFNDLLKEVCMVFFFTSVGFQANLKVLKSGGKDLFVFLLLVIGLIAGQNFLAVGLAKLLGLASMVGLCTGSIPMVGGHGTAGAFGPILEDFGVSGATTLCTAAATYGLIAGSVIGGPIAKGLIEKYSLLDTVVPEDDSLLVEDEIKHERHTTMYPAATFQLIIAMGIGTIISKLLSLTGADSLDNDSARAAFAEGNIGMKFGYTFDVGVLNDQFPAKCDWGVAQYPTYDENVAYKNRMDYGFSYMFNAHSKVAPEKLMEVMKFFTGDHFMLESYKEGVDIPYDPSLVEGVSLENAKHGWAEFAGLVKYGKMQPLAPSQDYAGAESPYETFINKIYSEQISIDEGIEIMNKNANQAVENYYSAHPDEVSEREERIDPNWKPEKR